MPKVHNGSEYLGREGALLLCPTGTATAQDSKYEALQHSCMLLQVAED